MKAAAKKQHPARRASIRALAKINLDLRVLGKRPDGYHELRTVFQTISLADRIEIAFTPGRRTEIVLDDPLNIPDNLVTRAARGAMEAMRVAGRVEIRLVKRIPMGAGLGGGSSDAAAVLLALPALAGGEIALPRLITLAQELGSDVPFFLMGGAAVGIGRGTELFPLPDGPALPGLLIAPGVHISTAEAYAGLTRRLTTESQENKIIDFQSRFWGEGCAGLGINDFETIVFEQHPELGALKKRLIRSGASRAMMTGSGSALFGLFRTRDQASRAMKLWKWPGESGPYRISLVSRVRYHSLWWRALEEHITGNTWPPRSRYAR